MRFRYKLKRWPTLRSSSNTRAMPLVRLPEYRRTLSLSTVLCPVAATAVTAPLLITLKPHGPSLPIAPQVGEMMIGNATRLLCHSVALPRGGPLLLLWPFLLLLLRILGGPLPPPPSFLA
ncbi:uncharacterized protein LOC131065935 [Cryptomeria japonica]|uniref:uncharacterized protein LOC131065935 n=1 Tax=Cryptomeria japonica TaxID=3369 RepID=UPI0027DA2385|nr:uncharacterized protein LOC131065935 [Cryptomeria japonica]